MLGQRVEITPGLLVGLGEIAPGALLFDDQDARPEEVDEAGAIVELGYMLFVAGHAAPPDPEDLEEVVVEALRLAASRKKRRAIPSAKAAARARTSFHESRMELYR